MSIDVEDSIKGFVKAIGRNEILPFLGIYQSLVYSYFFFKKLIKTYNPDFLLVTGGFDCYYLNQWQKKQLFMYIFLRTWKYLQKDYTSKI